jgi:glucose/arabinose dehydrogenase/mono/diheme cytochrome c family protein
MYLMNKVSIIIGIVFSILLFSRCQSETPKSDAAIRSPQEAIANMKLEDGFEVQVVSAEPHVEDPVALQFDADGNMWVVEMRGYMQDTEGRGENQPLGRIKILEDKDDDGEYETAHIFLDSLVMPRAVALVPGGVLVIEPPKLLFVENNNGKAGRKMILDSLFAEGGNIEHQPNGLMQAMDNWIYSAKSSKRIRYLNNKWVIENTQFRGQWGITQDDYGRLFYNDNSTTLLGDNFLPNAFTENQTYKRQSDHSYNLQLVSNHVFPSRSTTGVNRGYEDGALDSNGKLVNVTAACGPVIYRGDNFPDAYRGNAFVMEPSAYLIKRILLNQDSNHFVHGAFAYENKEFLTATDERFRPVNAYTAPDGTLFFIDMHRGVIQHTTYLTPYLRHYIDSLNLERPIGMGRIYRIKWKAHDVSKKLHLSTFSNKDLVQLLTHKNGWYRDMAQRLLIARGDTTIIADLKVLTAASNPVTELHALYTLEGLQALSPQFLLQAARQTADNFVYTTCMKLLENFSSNPAALNGLKMLAQKNRLAALQYVNSLPYFENAFPQHVKTELLQQMQAHRDDTLFLDAFMGSAAGNEQQRLAWLSANNKSDTVLRNLLKSSLAKREQLKHDPTKRMSKAEAELYSSGERTFTKVCATCHGATGDGITNVAPPLVGSQWVSNNDKSVPIRILLDGMHGPVDVAGKQYAPPQYSGTMPGLRNNIEMNNGTIAAVLTYVRNAWGNKSAAVTVQDVAAVRKETAQRQQPYTASELQSK